MLVVRVTGLESDTRRARGHVTHVVPGRAAGTHPSPLTVAALSHQRARRACWDDEVELFENEFGWAGGVGEGHVLQLHLTLHAGQLSAGLHGGQGGAGGYERGSMGTERGCVDEWDGVEGSRGFDRLLNNSNQTSVTLNLMRPSYIQDRAMRRIIQPLISSNSMKIGKYSIRTPLMHTSPPIKRNPNPNPTPTLLKP
jgi:hypothetical protein